MSLKHRLEQVVRLATVALEPGGLHAMLRWKPFSLTAFRMLRRLRTEPVEFRTILDGGANAGQFARAAVETYPEADLIAFEPLPDVAERLRAHLADCPRVTVMQTAIGATEGMLTFYRNAYSLSSSALPLHRNHRAAFPEAVPEATLAVPVASLDTLLANRELTPPVLLKLDLQGYEMQALRGAISVLEKVDFLLVETAFRPLYEGEPLFAELYDYLASRGFRLVRPLDVLEGTDGAILQMDALFARTATATTA